MPGQDGRRRYEQGVVQVKDEDISKPSEATGTAALRAGWSHGHRDVSGGWLRPTVFGAVDGLVTNASLIAGLGGGGVSAHTVVLTGVAALVAGLRQLLPADLHPHIDTLTHRQLVALRFASDQELADLVREVIAGQLATPKDIKLRVRNWRPDWLRA